jgi:hypothetical protein
MNITIVLTRGEVDEIFAEHLRKKIPDLLEVKSGVGTETTIMITMKESGHKRVDLRDNPSS